MAPPSGESATEVLLRLGRQRAQSLKRQVTPQQIFVAAPAPPPTPGWDYDPDDEFRNPRNYSPDQEIRHSLGREPESVNEAEEHRDAGSLSESSADSEFELPTPVEANPYEAFALRKPLAEMWEGWLGVHHDEEGRKDAMLDMMENVELNSEPNEGSKKTCSFGSESGSPKKRSSQRMMQRASAPLLKTPVKVEIKATAETGNDPEQKTFLQPSPQQKGVVATPRRSRGERQVHQCLQPRRGGDEEIYGSDD
jgi:hypothetical protein